MQATYLKAAASPDHFETYGLREVCFVGRSNSGKSTLLNALTNRKGLARTSATPGRTQLIHFFSLQKNAENNLIMVDLPGYGYSKASKRHEKNWSILMGHYIQRPELQTIFYLFDIRRPLVDFEYEFIGSLIADDLEVVIVLNKVDKLKQKEKDKLTKEWHIRLAGLKVRVIQISGLKNRGLNELHNILWQENQ